MTAELTHTTSTSKMMFGLAAPIVIPMSMFAGGIIELGNGELLSGLIEKSLFFGAVFVLTLSFLTREDLNRFSVWVIMGATVCLIGFAPMVIARIIELIRIDIQTSIPLLRVVCICCWILFVMNVDWDSPILWTALLLFGLLVTGLNLALWIRQGHPVPFMGFTPQKNVLATVGFCGTFIGVKGLRVNRERNLFLLTSGLLLLMSLTVVYASGGRKALLGIFVAAGVYWAWQVIRSSAWIHTTLFLLLCVGGYAVVPIYLNMEQMPFYWAVDDFLIKSQNQDLYTGREVVWPDVSSLISEHPWFGHGHEYRCLVGRFSGRDQGLSAHNLALAVLYQSGIAGALGMVFFFWSVWWCLCRAGHRDGARLSGAFMLAAIVTQYFTVSLIQNLFVGLGLWTIIASGLATGRASVVRLKSMDSVREVPVEPSLMLQSMREA